MTTTLDTAPASPEMLSEAAPDVPTREEVSWAVQNLPHLFKAASDEARADAVERLSRMLYKAFLKDQIDGSKLPAPKFGPIGQEVFERTYSRPIYKIDPYTEELLRDEDDNLVLQDWWTWKRPEDGRTKENWADMCRRVSAGSLKLAEGHELPDEALDLFASMYEFKVIPAGRHLWVTGTGSPFAKNCWVAPVGPRTSDHFKFAALRLFEGGGVGSNYSTDLWSKSQTVVGNIDLRITCTPRHADFKKVVDAAGHTFDTDGYGDVPYEEEDCGFERFMVDDSREGWAEVWTYLIDKSMEEGTHKILVDVSQIRKYGAPLKTFGGQASGPDPLVSACVAIVGVLNGAHGRRLNGLEAMEIDHQIAMSVVAGGTRRSARMSLMRWDDEMIEEFLNCKIDPDKHWTTNISVEIDSDFKNALEDTSHPKHELATHVLESIALGMSRDGEPGIVDTEQMSIGQNARIRMTNPCGEAILEFDPGDPENGIEGAGESCNLGSVNMDAFGTDTEGLIEAVRLTARVLYRATLNQHPNEAARRIEDRNRRIGVGFLGLQGWCIAHGAKLTDLAWRTDLQDILIQMRLAARDAANQLADELGTPRPISVTAVAPTGTIAQLVGVTPGMSPVMYKYFIRRVRFESNNPKLEQYMMQGYVVEDDVYAQNTSVVEFPVMDGMLAKYPQSSHLIEDSTEITFEQFMDLVDVVQNTFCGGTDGQAVSSTAQLPEHADTDMLQAGIKKVLGKVKGVTAFPPLSRPQMPYEHLSEEAYNETISYIMDEDSLVFDSNDGNCGTGGCPIV